MNYGQGRGFGFRGISPDWPYIGRGRGGLPRCARYLGSTDSPGPALYPGPARDDAADNIRRQIEALQAQLNDIEARMPDSRTEQNGA